MSSFKRFFWRMIFGSFFVLDQMMHFNLFIGRLFASLCEWIDCFFVVALVLDFFFRVSIYWFVVLSVDVVSSIAITFVDVNVIIVPVTVSLRVVTYSFSIHRRWHWFFFNCIWCWRCWLLIESPIIHCLSSSLPLFLLIVFTTSVSHSLFTIHFDSLSVFSLRSACLM